QGEHHVTSDRSVVLTTVLGSCVAACLCDPYAGVGGMNHFLLPQGAGDGADPGRRYGAYAMELLIHDLRKAGARRGGPAGKLFGGGRMFNSLWDVGLANADFAERFLRDEGIRVVSGSLRGVGGRRLHYWPATGRALQRGVADAAAPRPAPAPVAVPAGGELE